MEKATAISYFAKIVTNEGIWFSWQDSEKDGENWIAKTLKTIKRRGDVVVSTSVVAK